MSEERQEAWRTANRWLDGRINAFVDLVPGDPDCAGCALARQYLRALDKIAQLQEILDHGANANNADDQGHLHS